MSESKRKAAALTGPYTEETAEGRITVVHIIVSDGETSLSVGVEEKELQGAMELMGKQIPLLGGRRIRKFVLPGVSNVTDI